MRPQYLYAMLEIFGKCWVITDQATESYSMAKLLQDGWVPIRETPYHTSPAYVLVLLEREPEGEMGFGFKKG